MNDFCLNLLSLTAIQILVINWEVFQQYYLVDLCCILKCCIKKKEQHSNKLILKLKMALLFLNLHFKRQIHV